MQSFESSTCHTDYSCHAERSEVSQVIDSKRDFSPTAQNDKERVTQNDNAPTCHTERSEVSTMESRFFAIAQNDKENSIK
ncbi:hypothetical protein LS77_003515 [Helicobacter bilis]|uniref:Uncharacterized protein n=2 Tax=Helicobacter bilis TaxID=37372 RepID=A0A6D2C8G1_9HELI|nr:hypothetical protein [Helicobacter bilis]EMZ37433.1 hypothetical protein C826_01997 [Helicobacter bilis WiWa]TLE05294.1 hypothetical protein LS77_003515 [Helicobacter bilis]TLE06416.1 hypothetical protein LS76_002810 [Helicobacter bilis]